MSLKVAIAELYRPEGGLTGMQARFEELAAAARKQGARLLVLPELHNGPYFCQEMDEELYELAECLPGPTSDFLCQLARRYDLVIVGSLFERVGIGTFYNTAVVVERDGSIGGRYRKMHIPQDPGFSEKYYFTPSADGFDVIETSVGRLGVLICWDQWFPEAARIMALKGAEMLIYPTAIGSLPSEAGREAELQECAWTTVQKGHGVANGLPVLVANRRGQESTASSTIAFWGASFVSGPQGELLASARARAEADELIVADLDLGRCRELRRIWPFFRDRRVEHYGALLGHGVDGSASSAKSERP